jgi:membrane protease YdiL (CAAX protease family)
MEDLDTTATTAPIVLEETLPTLKAAGPRLGMAILVSFIALVVSIAVAAHIGFHYGLLHRRPDSMLILIAGQMVSWPIAMYVGLVLVDRPWSGSYSINRFSLLLLPGVVVTCFGLSITLSYFSSLIPMPEAIRDSFAALHRGNQFMYFLAVVIIAPVAEELFFRGWMLRGFLSNYSPTKAIWLSAVIFAVFHLNPWQAVAALPLGLIAGWLVWRTGSLAPGMIGHFTLNFTSSYLLGPFSALMGNTPDEWSRATHVPNDMALIGGAICLAGLLLLWRVLRPSPVPEADTASGT